MNSWHIKYFIEASQQQSLQAAAQKYFITPSAVSQAIRTLESELGTPLLTHQKRVFQLTQEGQLFLEKATQLISQIDGLPDLMKSLSKEPQGLIQFAAARSLFTQSLSQKLMAVKAKYLKINFKIRSGIASEVKKFVENGEVDFGLLVDDHQTQNFSEKVIDRGNFVLFSRTDRKGKDIDSLVVTNPEKIEVIHLFKELKKKKLPLPQIAVEITSWTMISTLVLESDVVGYAPRYSIEEHLKNKKLKILDLGIRPFQFETKVIWKSDRDRPLGIDLLFKA